jgi:hypothetical protein
LEAEVFSSETLENTTRLDVVRDRKTTVFICTAVRIKKASNSLGTKHPIRCGMSLPWWKNQAWLSLVARHAKSCGKLMWCTVSTNASSKIK